MIRITHPRPQAGRQRFLGIEFVDGTAQVTGLHPVREQALLQHGATIELEGVPLEDLSARELRELAVNEGIEVPKKASKAQIIALISAAPVRTLAVEFDLASQSRREFDDAPETGQV